MILQIRALWNKVLPEPIEGPLRLFTYRWTGAGACSQVGSLELRVVHSHWHCTVICGMQGLACVLLLLMVVVVMVVLLLLLE